MSSETTYETLSNKVGFATAEAVTIPPVEIAKRLKQLIELANSEDAMEAVMRVVRFAPSAKTPEEEEAKRICCEASQMGRLSFGG